MSKFEFAKGWENCGTNLPVRKTTGAAGYDFEVAEDIIIPSFFTHSTTLGNYKESANPHTLNEMAAITKITKAKPTLVPTGVKCKLDKGTYLELSVRSSCPLKFWLILANSVGIIDEDYYGNPDNDGHIYFQMINLSPIDIQLKKGDIIGQGIIKPYLTTEDDCGGAGSRIGGFGSTNG